MKKITALFAFAVVGLGFRLRNLATEGSANDFALDNIYFGETTLSPSYLAGTTAILSAGDIENPSNLSSAVPEPGQVAASLLLLGGILGYVFLKRRKLAKSAVPCGRVIGASLTKTVAGEIRAGCAFRAALRFKLVGSPQRTQDSGAQRLLGGWGRQAAAKVGPLRRGVPSFFDGRGSAGYPLNLLF